MSAKHTPGPWSVHADPDNPGCCTIYPDHGHPIGDCGAYFDPGNARLIAAAPDLLEALEELRGAVIDLDQDEEGSVNLCEAAIRKARIAIAKARGEK